MRQKPVGFGGTEQGTGRSGARLHARTDRRAKPIRPQLRPGAACAFDLREPSAHGCSRCGDEPSPPVGEADGSNRRSRSRAIQIAPERHVADQGRAHGRSASRRRCRLGQLLGIDDIRAQKRTRTCVVMHAWLSSATAAAAILVSAFAVPVAAHEIGTTHVSALVEDGRFDIQVVTDAASLAEKLDAATAPRSPGGSPAPTTAEAIRDRLVALDDTFRQRVTVRFDDSAVHPNISYSVSPAVDDTSPIVATIRLSGDVPRDAHHFTWGYSWTFAVYALTLKTRRSDDPITVWLEGGQTSSPQLLAAPTAPVSRIETAWRYLALGFTHIVPHGLDHMLFVIGIFLLSGRLRTVLWQVSAFTVAHSITLGLSIYGVITAPPAIVEPLIAVSIAYVAIENVLVRELKPWRIGLVFAFGLLHGMGFAGALRELGLPRSEFLTALVTFNLGVETGQLAVIGAAFLLVGWQCRDRAWYRGRVIVPASVAIACTALYWTVERSGFRL